MTTGLAIELAERLMQEMGFEKNYQIKFRHFQIPPTAKIEINLQNQVLILIAPDLYVNMYSKSGIYNTLDKGIKEMQYIHKGATVIANQKKDERIQVKVLQVIPKKTGH